MSRFKGGDDDMLYKVTPMMAPPLSERKPRAPGQPRKRRKSAIYDAEGNEVLITLVCLKCKQIKPLQQFGLRKMADGAIRNQPWCRTCRSAPSPAKATPEEIAEVRIEIASSMEAQAQAAAAVAQPEVALHPAEGLDEPLP